MRTKNHTDRESIEHNALALCKVLVMWMFLSLGEIQGGGKTHHICNNLSTMDFLVATFLWAFCPLSHEEIQDSSELSP
jgi:hypothetical protein